MSGAQRRRWLRDRWWWSDRATGKKKVDRFSTIEKQSRLLIEKQIDFRFGHGAGKEKLGLVCLAELEDECKASGQRWRKRDFSRVVKLQRNDNEAVSEPFVMMLKIKNSFLVTKSFDLCRANYRLNKKMSSKMKDACRLQYKERKLFGWLKKYLKMTSRAWNGCQKWKKSRRKSPAATGNDRKHKLANDDDKNDF